jgi:hypothetical protein
VIDHPHHDQNRSHVYMAHAAEPGLGGVASVVQAVQARRSNTCCVRMSRGRLGCSNIVAAACATASHPCRATQDRSYGRRRTANSAVPRHKARFSIPAPDDCCYAWTSSTHTQQCSRQRSARTGCSQEALNCRIVLNNRLDRNTNMRCTAPL